MNINNVRYFVSPENGIVRATLYGCEDDVFNIINKFATQPTTSHLHILYNWTDFIEPRDNGNCRAYLLPNTMSAVAKCAPEDEFDPEIGKKIALGKLKEKYNAAVTKRLFRIYDDLADIACLIYEYAARQNIMEFSYSDYAITGDDLSDEDCDTIADYLLSEDEDDEADGEYYIEEDDGTCMRCCSKNNQTEPPAPSSTSTETILAEIQRLIEERGSALKYSVEKYDKDILKGVENKLSNDLSGLTEKITKIKNRYSSTGESNNAHYRSSTPHVRHGSRPNKGRGKRNYAPDYDMDDEEGLF